jgi:hypothetical protein
MFSAGYPQHIGASSSKKGHFDEGFIVTDIAKETGSTEQASAASAALQGVDADGGFREFRGR